MAGLKETCPTPMSKLKRYYSKGQQYFVTVVTKERAPILVENYNELYSSIIKYKNIYNFELIAYVILPDHFHCIINPNEANLSKIMQSIKLSFARKLKLKYGNSSNVWQRRFWDHIIRDQDDMNNHIDYIHYNPVKHKNTKYPSDWRYSSINDFIEEGYYSKGWRADLKRFEEINFGE